MKRYEKINCTDDEQNMYGSILSETPDGSWVKYSDILSIIEENNRLTVLFNMQHKRSLQADKLWQVAMGNTHVLPDLGVLLSWFMDERARMFDERTEISRIVKNATDRLREVLG